jgi:hypothetical protein
LWILHVALIESIFAIKSARVNRENPNRGALNSGAVIEIIIRNTFDRFSEAQELSLALVRQRTTSAC